MTFKDYAKGAGSLLELFPDQNNIPTIERNSDKRVANAWNKVGDSFRKSITEYQINVKK